MKKNHKTLYMILTVLLVSFLFFGSREKNVVEGFLTSPLATSDKISCKNYKFSMEKGKGKNGEEYGNIIMGLRDSFSELQTDEATEKNCEVVEKLKGEVNELNNELNRIET